MSLLFIERPLVVNPRLASAIGLNEAIVLQQLHYWLTATAAGVEHDGKNWVYNTMEQWQEQFPFWSVDTIKRAIGALKAAGLISVERLNKHKHDQTNFYTIQYGHKALVDEGNLHQSGVATCTDVTEITTETTTENKSLRDQQADARKTIPYDEIFQAYASSLPTLPQIRIKDEARKRAIRSIWNLSDKFQSAEFFERYFRHIGKSEFLMGAKAIGFDWLMKPANFKKVIEGNYHNA